MPLTTAIVRNGESLKLDWSDFHVAAMVVAAALDSGQGPWEPCTPEGIIGCEHDPAKILGISPRLAFMLSNYATMAATPLNEGRYVLKGTYKFGYTDGGETLELLPGDELHALRD